jgi:hypothetical protein
MECLYSTYTYVFLNILIMAMSNVEICTSSVEKMCFGDANNYSPEEEIPHTFCVHYLLCLSSHPISLSSILTSFSSLLICLPSGILALGLLTKFLHALLISRVCVTA